MNYGDISKFLKTLAPDFCWCTAYELMLMMEQLDIEEEILWHSFQVRLSHLKSEGWFISKPMDRMYNNKYRETTKFNRGVIPHVYLRVKHDN